MRFNKRDIGFSGPDMSLDGGVMALDDRDMPLSEGVMALNKRDMALN
jgi:hypothetical protein